jgi:zinc protease
VNRLRGGDRNGLLRGSLLVTLSVVGTSCAATHAPAKTPAIALSAPSTAKSVATEADPFATPPTGGPTPDVPFPTIAHDRLDNGLELRVVTRKIYPLIELRLVIFSGSASDGKQTGVASLTGDMLKAGGAGNWSAADLTERAESLGSSIEIATGRDSTQIRMAITTGDFDAALDLLGAVAQRPRFAANEFAKLKERALEGAKSAAKSDPGWAASMVLYRELFHTGLDSHPYAHFDAQAADINRLTLAECRRWYQSHVTAKNAALVIAGDIDPSTVTAAARRVFGTWRGNRPEPPAMNEPLPPLPDTIWVVDRPHSAQSEILVAALGQERASPSWPAVTEVNQILGGGVAGRLFLDVREKRSLAYSTGSSLNEVAHGPVPIVLSAGTQTPKTAQALQALLDNAQKISAAPPTKAEVGTASRYLANSFLFKTETLGAVADMAAKLAVLGLPDDYFDTYRHALATLDSASLFRAAQQSFGFSNPVIVVAGDASQIAKPLTHFANIVVVDPVRGFEPTSQLPMNEQQSIDAANAAAVTPKP